MKTFLANTDRYKGGMMGFDAMNSKTFMCKYMDLQKKFQFENPIDCDALFSSTTTYSISLLALFIAFLQ